MKLITLEISREKLVEIVSALEHGERSYGITNEMCNWLDLKVLPAARRRGNISSRQEIRGSKGDEKEEDLCLGALHGICRRRSRRGGGRRRNIQITPSETPRHFTPPTTGMDHSLLQKNSFDEYVSDPADVYPNEVSGHPQLGGYQLAIAMDTFRGRYRESSAAG